MKSWQPFNDECLHCGSSAEVLTSTGQENLAHDGDEARCTECKCPGTVTVDESENDNEEGNAAIVWHDEPSCDCEWCKANTA